MDETEPGHRTVPHTADLRVEAWAPTREGCIAQAVLGTVDELPRHLVGASRAQPPVPADRAQRRGPAGGGARRGGLPPGHDQEAPLDVELEPDDGGVDVRFAMCDATALPQTGAVPKAVSLHELYFAPGPGGWRCSVTLDV